ATIEAVSAWEIRGDAANVNWASAPSTFVLPPTGANYGYVPIDVQMTGRSTLRCLDGSANLDWMQHD
ncbi:MAG: hypothetical protein QOE82_1917, partial [Thermoanaerobaculia bacterium]|nr:hypothetical protein [Thermoanaerobaculia bacterium]